MAEYYTQFSCAFDVGSAENAAHALVLLDELCDPKADDPPLGFEADLDPARLGVLLITDEDGQGDPEHVIRFALACAEAFDLRGRWGFTWALSCSKPRLDGFGGGAQLLDLGARKSLAWIDCDHWLAAALDPACDANIGIAQTAADGGETAMADVEPELHHEEVAIAPPREGDGVALSKRTVTR